MTNGNLGARRGCLAAIVGLLATNGCWVPDYLITGAAWSDDDEMFMIKVWHAEVPGRYGEIQDSDTPTRSVGYQVYIVPADLSEDAWAITPIRNNGSLECLMSGAGYFVEVRAEARIVSYTLDGDATVLFDVADAENLGDAHIVRMWPAPDGSQIAWLMRDFETERQYFGLMDPEGRLLAPLPELDANYIHYLGWTLEGQVFLERAPEPGTVSDALVWDVATQTFEARAAPRCSGEPTTCSQISEDGRSVRTGGSLESPVVIDEDPSLTSGPFSCSFDD